MALMDKDEEELLQRRLVETIRANVEANLFRYYRNLGSLIITVLGLVGVTFGRPALPSRYSNIATDFPVSDDNNGIGIWLNGGVYWTLSQHFNLGLDLRYSQADVTLFDVDAGGTHAGVILGYHW